VPYCQKYTPKGCFLAILSTGIGLSVEFLHAPAGIEH